MNSLEQLRRRVEGAQDLAGIARAMKALAAMRIRQAREAVERAHDYQETVRRALHLALRTRPEGVGLPRDPGAGSLLAVVFGSDLGLAGPFNARVAAFTRDRLRALEPDPSRRFVLAVGARMAGALEAEGVHVGDRLAAVGSLGAGLTLDREILMRLEGLRERQDPGRIVLAYARTLRGTEIHPVLLELLPLDSIVLTRLADTPWPTRCLPMVREPWATVFSAVVREFLFAGVFQAVAESHASEHASRLLAMEVAQRRIRERLDALQGSLNQQRKEAITAELLDLVSGCEAVLSPERAARHPSRSRGRTS